MPEICYLVPQGEVFDESNFLDERHRLCALCSPIGYQDCYALLQFWCIIIDPALDFCMPRIMRICAGRPGLSLPGEFIPA